MKLIIRDFQQVKQQNYKNTKRDGEQKPIKRSRYNWEILEFE